MVDKFGPDEAYRQEMSYITNLTAPTLDQRLFSCLARRRSA